MSLSNECERNTLDMLLLRCNFVRTRNIRELLWTSIVHLWSVLNEEYDWTALDSHRPFVICLEQGIWFNRFGQSSPICYPCWTRNMTELLWTFIAHLLSMLNKEYDWTALDNHRPFVIHLEQGIWLKFFGQASGTWRRVGSYLTYFFGWTCCRHLRKKETAELSEMSVFSSRMYYVTSQKAVWQLCSHSYGCKLGRWGDVTVSDPPHNVQHWYYKCA
jgi:hypothetical protein